MKKIFIDSDVILDVLANRKPFVEESSQILTLGTQGVLALYTSAVCFTNIYYLLAKNIRKTEARSQMIKLKKFVIISPASDPLSIRLYILLFLI